MAREIADSMFGEGFSKRQDKLLKKKGITGDFEDDDEKDIEENDDISKGLEAAEEI